MINATQRAQLRAAHKLTDAAIDAIVEAATGSPDTLAWHALNYRTAATAQAQAMFEALEDYVRRQTAPPPPQKATVRVEVLQDGYVLKVVPSTSVYSGETIRVHLPK